MIIKNAGYVEQRGEAFGNFPYHSSMCRPPLGPQGHFSFEFDWSNFTQGGEFMRGRKVIELEGCYNAWLDVSIYLFVLGRGFLDNKYKDDHRSLL